MSEELQDNYYFEDRHLKRIKTSFFYRLRTIGLSLALSAIYLTYDHIQNERELNIKGVLIFGSVVTLIVLVIVGTKRSVVWVNLNLKERIFSLEYRHWFIHRTVSCSLDKLRFRMEKRSDHYKKGPFEKTNIVKVTVNDKLFTVGYDPGMEMDLGLTEPRGIDQKKLFAILMDTRKVKKP